MTRGTTPTITLTIKGYDLSSNTNYVTISQTSGTELTLVGESVVASYDSETDKSTLQIYLSQEQTLAFSRKQNADIQLRTIDSEGTALASKIYHLNVNAILLEGVIEYA